MCIVSCVDCLKGNLEICVFWVGWNFPDARFSYIAGEVFFYILYAIIYFLRASLGEHFNRAVRHITYIACQLTAVCRSAGGEAEADALDPAGESYVPGDHFLFCILEQIDNINV